MVIDISCIYNFWRFEFVIESQLGSRLFVGQQKQKQLVKNRFLELARVVWVSLFSAKK